MSWVSGRRLIVVGAAVLSYAGTTVGCGKTMTEGDCERVGKHLRVVWDAEVEATRPQDEGPKSERAKLVLAGEGERMTADWLSQCRRELDGRSVDDKEIQCLLAAKTIADVQTCGAPKPK